MKTLIDISDIKLNPYSVHQFGITALIIRKELRSKEILRGYRKEALAHLVSWIHLSKISFGGIMKHFKFY